MKQIFLCVFFLGVCSSCAHDSPEEFTRYYEDGRAKPNIVIAPIIDSSSVTNDPWSLPEEFLETILAKIALKSTLYVSQDTEVGEELLLENPFGSELSWVREE